MAAKGSALDNILLQVLFNGGGPYSVGSPAITLFENASSGTIATNLYVSLHTGTLTASSNQTTSEAAYGSYARVAVARTSGGWTVTGGSVSPASTVTFPQATNAGSTAGAGTETETYLAIGVASTGTGAILYWGPISPNITVSQGVQPELTVATQISET